MLETDVSDVGSAKLYVISAENEGVSAVERDRVSDECAEITQELKIAWRDEILIRDRRKKKVDGKKSEKKKHVESSLFGIES